jgi:hypothetical protein
MKSQNPLGVISILGGYVLSLRPLWPLRQNKKMQNKPNFISNIIIVSHFIKTTYQITNRFSNWLCFPKQTQFPDDFSLAENPYLCYKAVLESLTRFLGESAHVIGHRTD